MRDLRHLKPEKLVAIGASTGGPAQIKRILDSLKGDMGAAIIIAQHMNSMFIDSFVKRLNQHAHLDVFLLEKGTKIEQGCAYIATGKTDIDILENSLYCKNVTPTNNHFNPDINYLFASLAPFASEIKILGVILTGIGDDGAQGCLKMSINGAKCIAESESSAIVYGMPQRAKEMVAGIKVEDIDEIIVSIGEFSK